MSGTYPTSPIFNAVNFKSRWYNVASSTQTGRTQGRHLGGHRFEFTATYPILKRTDFGPVDAFLMNQVGGKETFTIVLPEISEQSGTATGTITVDGAHSIGDSTVDIQFQFGGLSGNLKAGDVVVFANHSKVYKLTADVASDASSPGGTGTMSIQPPLIAALVDTEAVTYDDVPFTVRQSNDLQEYEVTPGVFYSFEVDMIEAV